MAENSRFHLINMRLLFARRECIEAAIARVQEELSQEMTHEPNLETLRAQIHVFTDRYHTVEMNGQPHTITAQYDAVFMPRLVVAPFLEVGNVQDAEYLVDLRATKYWGGAACMDDDFIPIEAVGSIVQTLEAGLVPIRNFHRDEVGNPVFD